MPRCSGTTLSGKRCRNKAGTDSLCPPHREHGDKKQTPSVLTPEGLAAVHQEIRTDSDAYNAFCRSYYNILRELYNVAGEEMADEYIRFKTLGRAKFNAFHKKAYPSFLQFIE